MVNPPAPPVPPVAPVDQACAVNFDKPCPLPKWKATWELSRSTSISVCNFSGWYDPKFAAKWGLVRRVRREIDSVAVR